MSTWWIDKPVLMGSSNPTDTELEHLRSGGFTLVVSLLDEAHQPPMYNPQRLEQLGLRRVNIPVADFQAPSLAQLCELAELVGSECMAGKTVVHCHGGTGRTGTAAVAYWISKGIPLKEAVARVREARPGAVETDEQLAALQQFEDYCRATAKTEDMRGGKSD